MNVEGVTWISICLTSINSEHSQWSCKDEGNQQSAIKTVVWEWMFVFSLLKLVIMEPVSYK